MKNKFIILLILMSFLEKKTIAQTEKISLKAKPGEATAVFAEGCFWCSEHVFEAVVGVKEVISGYAGGTTDNPTYEEVGKHNTGHAEAVLIYYDPAKVTFKELVDVFFTSHDPTTPNRQGPDEGSSYRSIAFYQNEEEKKIIEQGIAYYNVSGIFANKIITEVKPIEAFFKAEAYHQDFVKRNPYQGYVRSVSIPRFEKFKKTYKGKLK
ncbi:MAG: peptide-methionine (S)-S-oxide reductase MsrA [Chitinophagaceae bacterium]|nr:peptide-methionine (S)-S-oxide reductase MsrA [Chitinophagaceae bacterium]